MATYTLVSHNSVDYVKAVGTGVTAQALHTFIQANPTTGASYGYSDINGDSFRFNADILIGDSSNSGSLTTWDISRDNIFIDARTTFEVHGIITGGNLDSDGFSENGCSLRINATATDKVILKDNAEINLYGSLIACPRRIKVDGNDAAFRCIDCDRELDDDIQTNTSQNFVYEVTRSRIHHTGAVGLKIFSKASSGSRTQFLLDDVKIQQCTYAFQAGTGTNSVIRNTELDSCTNHIVGFEGNGSIIRFIDSDVAGSLRMVGAPSNGIFSLENSYTFFAQDLQQNPLQGVSTWIVDEQGDTRVEATTDSSGNLVTSVDTLNRKTYVGSNETSRGLHTVFYRSPNTVWGEVPVNVVGIAPININLFLSIDQYYTQTDVIAQSHTGITITDHGGSPVTWNNLEYRFTISCDTSVNPSLDTEDVYNYLKYHQSQIGTFLGINTREVHQLLSVVGGEYYTNTSSSSYYSGVQAGVRVVDQSDSAFLGVNRHYSNSGVYSQGAEESSISIPNAIDGSRVVAINYTRSTKIIDQYGQEIITVPSLIDNSVVSGGNGYSHTFVVGGNNINQIGDVVLLKVNWQSGTQAKIPLRIFQIITQTGITAIESQEDDLIHNNLVFDGVTGIDGSTVDSSNGGELSVNFTNIEINVNDANDIFDCRRGIAWWRWINTTELGALYYDALGLVYLPDEYNIQIEGPLKIKNSKVDSELTIINGIWKHYQGESIIASDSYTILWVPNDRLYNSNNSQVEAILTKTNELIASLAAVPTNPLLTDDNRLNYIDANISNTATQASVDVVGNNVDLIKAKTDILVNTDLTGIATTSDLSTLATQSSIDNIDTDIQEILANHKNPTYYYGQDGTTRVEHNEAYFISLRSEDGSQEIRRINVIDVDNNPTNVLNNAGYN